MGKKVLALFWVLAFLLGAFSSNAHAGQKWKLHGPEIFKRTIGPTNDYQAKIRIPSFVKPEFTIIVHNGTQTGDDKNSFAVTSGSIWLNGHKVISEDGFKKKEGTIKKEISFEDAVTLKAVDLEVKLNGKPGTFITVSLYGKVDIGELNEARYGHDASLLPDGKVLLTGGKNRGTTLSSSEFFDPATRRFQKLSSPMSSPRSDHSSSILPSGRVLQAGGNDGIGSLSSAELFDPASVTFSVATEMIKTGRAGHSSTLLSDGTVLIVGGMDAANHPLSSSESFGSKSAEIFDPKTGAFTGLDGVLNVARAYHSATLMPDGKVLIAGGDGGTGPLDSAEIYDPVTQTFTLLDQRLSAARSRHAAVLLPDGKVLFLGGQNGAVILKSADVFDTVFGIFTAIPETLHEARAGHTATLLTNGMILVAGGQEEAKEDEGEEDAEFFEIFIGDKVSPSVVSISPADKAIAVPVNSFVAVRFSEPVDVTTVSAATFTLKDADGNPVAGTTVPAEGGLLAFFLPASALTFAETYTVSLSAEINDTSGNLLQPFTGSFRAIAPPVVTDFSPAAERSGKTVTINGRNFYPDISKDKVWFNGTETIVTAATATTLTVMVPKGAASGPLTVTTPEGSTTSVQNFTVLPDNSVIKNILPAGATNGDTVQIVGDYFNEVPAENVVSFAGPDNTIIQATPTAATAKSLTVVIPDKAITGSVKVTTRGESSNPFSYVISPPRDFTIAMVPNIAQVGQGCRTTYQVTVTPKGEFTELVSLAASGLPAGAVATFEPAKVAPGQKSLVTVIVVPTTPIDITQFTITGTATLGDRVLTHATSAYLSVLDGKGTSFSGKVFDIDGNPLKGVTVYIGNISTSTDETGQFLLVGVPVGDQILIIDGTSANTATVAYPVIPFTVNIVPNIANVFKQTAYLHRINKDHVTPIVYPNEVLATDPRIPDFVLRIPAGTSIKDWKGNQVDKVSVMQVPIDRLAVNALPAGVSPKVVYMFSFDRWGGATPSRPIPVIFPNDIDALPGEKVDLWYYDESPNLGDAPNDWRIFGTGTVSPDGLRIISDPGVGIPKFCCGASFPSRDPRVTDPRPSPDKRNRKGDPVDTASGIFTLAKTDMTVPGRIPLVLKRNYSSADVFIGPFGRGSFSGYDAGILTRRTGDANVIYYFTADGVRSRFVLQADGSFKAADNPELAGVKIVRITDGSEMHYPDGTVSTFKASGNMDWLVETKDVNGNFLKIDRGGSAEILKISNSDGSYLQFYLSGGFSGNYAYSGVMTLDANGRAVPYSMPVVSVGSGGGGSVSGWVPLPIIAGSGRYSIVDSVKDHTGRLIKYTYDSDDKLISVKDPEGGVTSYTYDANNRLESITDARGIKYLVNEYDTSGKVTKQTQPDSITFSFEYGMGGATVAASKVINPNGSNTVSRFNSRGFTMTEIDELGLKTSFERNYTNNQLLSVTDPLYRVTRFTYDDLGSITSILRPLDNITLVEYDPIFHKPSKVTDALNRNVSLTYDPKGNLATATDPAGNATVFTYNAKGLVETATDPLKNVATYLYDERGNLSTVIDPLGNKTVSEYDALNRPINVTNGNGKTSKLTYDGLNRVASTTDPAGNITSFTYDGNGNLLTVTDAKGQQLSYEYDSMDRVSAQVDARGQRETYTYNASGKLASKTDSKGQITAFSYDAANRLAKAAYADGSYTEYVYDAGGRVSAVKDSVAGTITYTYDQLNRVIREVTPQGAVEYDYDILGRRTAMTATGQEKVAYGYDQQGNLSTITQGVTTVNLTYDKLGRRTGITYPNNVQTTYTWDAAGKLSNLNHAAAANTVENIGLAYDGAGNIIRKSRERGTEPLPVAVTNTVAQGNQTTASVKAADNIAYTYDANGNLTSKTDAQGTTSFSWDARNRLVAIGGPNVTASFKYDAFGRRIEKTINSKTTTFLYDGLDIIQEQESGAVKANYLRTLSIDEVLARTDANGVCFYQHDQLGSTVALTDENGITKTIYSYDPYGNTSVSGESLDQPFQYTGRENDGTGLYYYRARYYSTEMHKFISQDPLANLTNIYTKQYSGTFDEYVEAANNGYAYVSNNPANYIDPDGLRVRKGVLVPIRKWLKKNITPKGMTDEAVDAIVGVIGLRTFLDDILDPTELGDGFDDEYMIRTFKYTPTPTPDSQKCR